VSGRIGSIYPGFPAVAGSPDRLSWSCQNAGRLPVAPLPVHADRKFSVTETEAAAIRRVFEEEGELSAMIELRRHFPGITDNAKARECARTIAGWKPALAVSRPVTRLQPGKRRSAG
jgi:hypothetical protein